MMCPKPYDERLMCDCRLLLPVVMAAFLSVSSCSVKEDRNPCPCLLELDIKGPDGMTSAPVDLFVISQDGYFLRDTVEAWKQEGLYSVSVPRTQLHVSVWSGGGKYVSEDGLVIPTGMECPRVYMHDSDVVTEGEYCREEVFMRKNHCVLTILAEGDGQEFTGLVLKGNVAGYDMTGKPLRGDFEFALEEDIAVLPRQVDDSLMLELQDSKGNRISFSLGRYIEASGYDWSAPELDDVTVTLDYALTEIRLNVDGWESVYRYDMEI